MRNLILLLFILLVWSCKEERGCTNIHSINYNQDATIDNGDCRFEWDNWIGLWSVSDECTVNGVNFYNIEIIKTEDVTKSNVIIIGLYGEDSRSDANITNGILSIMDVNANGEGSLEGIKATVNYSWSPFGDQCTSTWFKE